MTDLIADLVLGTVVLVTTVICWAVRRRLKG